MATRYYGNGSIVIDIKVNLCFTRVNAYEHSPITVASGGLTVTDLKLDQYAHCNFIGTWRFYHYPTLHGWVTEDAESVLMCSFAAVRQMKRRFHISTVHADRYTMQSLQHLDLKIQDLCNLCNNHDGGLISFLVNTCETCEIWS